jgi:hypothetical protein
MRWKTPDGPDWMRLDVSRSLASPIFPITRS